MTSCRQSGGPRGPGVSVSVCVGPLRNGVALPLRQRPMAYCAICLIALVRPLLAVVRTRSPRGCLTGLRRVFKLLAGFRAVLADVFWPGLKPFGLPPRGTVTLLWPQFSPRERDCKSARHIADVTTPMAGRSHPGLACTGSSVALSGGAKLSAASILSIVCTIVSVRSRCRYLSSASCDKAFGRATRRCNTCE